ncbi:hypothetical protein NUSPORA_00083 [Nucleospora cyclopteri]
MSLFFISNFNIFDMEPKLVENTKEAILSLSTIFDIVCISDEMVEDSVLYLLIDPLNCIKQKIFVKNKKDVKLDVNKANLVIFEKKGQPSYDFNKNTVLVRNTNAFDLVEVAKELLRQNDLRAKSSTINTEKAIIDRRKSEFRARNIFNNKKYEIEIEKIYNERKSAFNKILSEVSKEKKPDFLSKFIRILKQSIFF